MQHNLIGYLVVVAIAVSAVPLSFLFYYRRRIRQNHERDQKNQQAWADNELRKKRDHQLNHGRQVFNWLSRELLGKEADGIVLNKIEDNGRKFSILVRDRSYGHPVVPILQMDFDFADVGKGIYKGHIFYGANGPDILFPVLDHSPRYGLDRLVLREIEESVARNRQRASR